MMTVRDLLESACQSSPDGKYWEPALPSYLLWRTRLRDAWAVCRGDALAFVDSMLPKYVGHRFLNVVAV